MLDPILRRRYGFYAIFLAVVFFSVALAAGAGNAIRRQGVANELAAANQECVNRLGSLGAKAIIDTDGDTVVANWEGVGEGYKTVSNASTAALACPGWVMSKFCMGEGCSPAKASMTLRKAAL